VVTCEIKQKQNTETILKRFRIVSELFISIFIRMSKNMQILKLFQWFQPITNDHTPQTDDVINDVVQYDYCEYGEQVFRR